MASKSSSRKSSSMTSYASMRSNEVRIFEDEKAKAKYEKDFAHKNICPAREVNLFYFKENNLNCFNLLKNSGVECLYSLKERVYPQLVREFYSSLRFHEADPLTGTAYLRGYSLKINPRRIASLLSFKSSGADIKIYDNPSEASKMGFIKSKAILSLTGKQSEQLDPTSLELDDRILHHAVAQILLPHSLKGNNATFSEIFFMWCIKREIPLDVPFIIISHMKAFTANAYQDLPYAMLITLIAKKCKIDLNEFAGETANPQANYDARMIKTLKYKRPESEKEAAKGSTGRKKGKRPAPSPPARKSYRLSARGDEETEDALSKKKRKTDVKEKPALINLDPLSSGRDSSADTAELPKAMEQEEDTSSKRDPLETSSSSSSEEESTKKGKEKLVVYLGEKEEEEKKKEEEEKKKEEEEEMKKEEEEGDEDDSLLRDTLKEVLNDPMCVDDLSQKEAGDKEESSQLPKEESVLPEKEPEKVTIREGNFLDLVNAMSKHEAMIADAFHKLNDSIKEGMAFACAGFDDSRKVTKELTASIQELNYSFQQLMLILGKQPDASSSAPTVPPPDPSPAPHPFDVPPSSPKL